MDGRFGRARRDSGRVAWVLAIVLGVSAIAAVGIWFAFGYLGWGSEGRFETPAWDDVRRGALPIAEPEVSEPEGGESTQAPPPRPTVDPRIVEIADNLNKQFARNPGQETAFTDAYPRRALESWINDRAGVPADLREHFVEALVAASRGIGEDPMINRIGSVPDRVQAVQDALFSYRDEYVHRVETAAQEAEAAAQARADRANAVTGFFRELGSGTRTEAGSRAETALDWFASVKRALPINLGLSTIQLVVLGVGVVALIVVLVLFLTGVGRKRVQPTQAELEEPAQAEPEAPSG